MGDKNFEREREENGLRHDFAEEMCYAGLSSLYNRLNFLPLYSQYLSAEFGGQVTEEQTQRPLH